MFRKKDHRFYLIISILGLILISSVIHLGITNYEKFKELIKILGIIILGTLLIISVPLLTAWIQSGED